MKKYIIVILSFLFILVGCNSSDNDTTDNGITDTSFLLGVENTDQYLNFLDGKRVGLVVNPTSHLANDTHTIDFLIDNNINVTTLFAPEHGIRGDLDAGEEVDDEIDSATGLPIISLYGDHKKPTTEDLENVDVMIFDIQDVGVRFYTYISTMHYVMESVAENGKQMVIFDRPNPNGDYFAGPIMQPENTSFVGVDPLPVVHGLTIGELALMINGEGWLENGVQIPEADLLIAKMQGYDHQMPYSLPTAPSPNLQTDEAIQLYPSLGLFESTTISVGRGTDMPFEVIGYPDPALKINTEFQIEDTDAAWPQRAQYVYGESFRIAPPESTDFTLEPLYRWYWKMRDLGYSSTDIVDRDYWLELLLGTDDTLPMIESGMSYQDIESTWDDELAEYSLLRDEYLLYDK